MNIREKSQERLQVQAEWYFGTHNSDFDHGLGYKASLFLRNAPELALIKDFDNLDEDNLPDRMDLDDIEDNLKGYMDSFKWMRYEKRWRENILFFEEKTKKYNEEIKPVIEPLLKKIKEINSKAAKDPDNRYTKRVGGEYYTFFKNEEEIDKLPETIRTGLKATTFRVENGKEKYIIRMLNNDREGARMFGINEGVNAPDKNAINMFEEILDLHRLDGIKNVPILLGYSYKDNVIVMNDLGDNGLFDELQTIDEKTLAYTDEQVVDLVNKIYEIREKGLAPKYSLNNLLYSQEKGFSIVDFENSRHFRDDDKKIDLLELNNIFRLVAIYKKCNFSAEDRKYGRRNNIHIEDQLAAALPATVHLIEVLKENFPDAIKKDMSEFQIRAMIYGDRDINERYFNKLPNNPDFQIYVNRIKELLEEEKTPEVIQ